MSFVFIIVIPLIAEAVDWCREDFKCPYEVPQEHTMCMFEDETETPRCSGIVDLQSDANRKLIVQLHNEYRRKIAMGEVSGWPPAANMKRLTYDMTLETIAFRWATQCWPDNDRCRKTLKWQFVGQNIAREVSCVPKFLGNPKKDVSKWWSEILNTDPLIVDGFSLMQTSKAQFTQMIWATTEKVGCAMVAYKLARHISCPYLSFTVCNYGPGGNMISYPVYERGPPCSNCPYGDCVCETSPMTNPLAVEKSGNIWGRTARNFKNKVNVKRKFYNPTVAGITNTVLNSAKFGSRKYWCSEELTCKNVFPPEHTMCRYQNQRETPRCSGIVNLMTDCDRKKILRSHNFYRNKIAMGQVPGWPAATNIRMLTYDKTLEKMAYRWATQCVEEHDKCRKTTEWRNVGQNIVREYGQTPRTMTNTEGDVETWWGEVDEANPRIVDGVYFETDINVRPIGHFVQLVWAKTEKVGCAMVSYKTKKRTQHPYVRVTVCNYGPGGNVFTHPVYEKGPPCSECPTKTTCVCGFKETAIRECNEPTFPNPHYDLYYPLLLYYNIILEIATEPNGSSRSSKHSATRSYMPFKAGETPFLGNPLYGRTTPPEKVPNRLVQWPQKSYIPTATHPFKNQVTMRIDLMDSPRNKERARMQLASSTRIVNLHTWWPMNGSL